MILKMKNIIKSATLLFIVILLVSCGGKRSPQHPYTKIILSSNFLYELIILIL
jgi:hypothetical protein